MIGVDYEESGSQLTTEALDASDNTTGFEVEGQMAFGVEGGAADVDNGAHMTNGAVVWLPRRNGTLRRTAIDR